MDLPTLQLWLLVGIAATLFFAFVIVTILLLLDLVSIVNLPPSVSGPLRGTLILQFAVIAIGAIGALLAPNLIQQNLNKVARQVGTVSDANSNTSTFTEEPAVSSAVAEISCGTPDLAPLVYIQFAAEQRRSVAEGVQAAARAEGWFAPGIELTTNYTRANSQVRYFRTSERADAEALAARLLAAGALPEDTGVVEVKADVRACQFEVWIGTGSD